MTHAAIDFALEHRNSSRQHVFFSRADIQRLQSALSPPGARLTGAGNTAVSTRRLRAQRQRGLGGQQPNGQGAVQVRSGRLGVPCSMYSSAQGSHHGCTAMLLTCMPCNCTSDSQDGLSHPRFLLSSTPLSQVGQPAKDFSDKSLKKFKLDFNRDGEHIVCQSVSRLNAVTNVSERCWLPVLAIEDLLATVQELYDGSMGVETLYFQVGGCQHACQGMGAWGKPQQSLAVTTAVPVSHTCLLDPRQPHCLSPPTPPPPSCSCPCSAGLHCSHQAVQQPHCAWACRLQSRLHRALPRKQRFARRPGRLQACCAARPYAHYCGACLPAVPGGQPLCKPLRY